jgi:hypothetical protein
MPAHAELGDNPFALALLCPKCAYQQNSHLQYCVAKTQHAAAVLQGAAGKLMRLLMLPQLAACFPTLLHG